MKPLSPEPQQRGCLLCPAWPLVPLLVQAAGPLRTWAAPTPQTDGPGAPLLTAVCTHVCGQAPSADRRGE